MLSDKNIDNFSAIPQNSGKRPKRSPVQEGFSCGAAGAEGFSGRQEPGLCAYGSLLGGLKETDLVTRSFFIFLRRKKNV